MIKLILVHYIILWFLTNLQLSWLQYGESNFRKICDVQEIWSMLYQETSLGSGQGKTMVVCPLRVIEWGLPAAVAQW